MNEKGYIQRQSTISAARLDYIDIAKFFGVLCMIYGHSGLPDFLQQYIHIYHMPLFFILSGYTFNLDKHLKNPKNFYLSRLKTILLPYLLFSSILYALRYILGIIGFQKCIGFSEFIRILFVSNALDSFQGTVQWFLSCLFFTEVFAFTFLYIISKVTHSIEIRNCIIFILLVLFTLLGCVWFPITNMRLPMAIDVSFTGVALYLIGFLIRKYNIVSSLSKYKLIVFSLLIIGSVVGMHTEYISMRELTFGNPIIFYFDAVAISISVMCISLWISKCCSMQNSILYKYILWLGSNTLLLLVFNHVVIYAFNIVERLLPNDRVIEVILVVVRPIATIAIISVVILVINKYLPFMIGKPLQKKPSGSR